MPWVRFDDMFPLHRKVKGLSDAAYRLHSEAIFWCARNLMDGFVPAEDVSSVSAVRRPHKYLTELVRRDLWIERDDGWEINDYLDFQPSKAKVQHQRAVKAERQARWMAKKRGIDPSRDASIGAPHDASKTHAPPRPEKGGGGGSPERRPSASAPHGAGDDHRKHITAALDKARADPRARCRHGTDAGRFIRPDTGQPHCALCRQSHTQETA